MLFFVCTMDTGLFSNHGNVGMISNSGLLVYVGYKLVEHMGDLYGFHSSLTMLPDMDIGTFFICNFGKHYLEREIISMFLLDILLDGESFLDADSACEFLDDIDSSYNAHGHVEVQTLKGNMFAGIYIQH